MNPSRFVYFDLGMVLVEFDHTIGIRQLAAVTGATETDAQRVVFESGLQNEYETGLVTSEQFAAQINGELGSHATTSAIIESLSAIFTLNEPILPVLESVRASGLPMGILSNTCQGHWEWIAKQNLPVPGDWFEFAVLSYEAKSMKPDAGIYEVSESRCHCAGSNIFFTDDRKENIQAANARGWSTHLYRHAGDLLHEFQSWLAAD
ncbi:MAG: HAD family phosphatase [Planctomycetota bacterium]